LWIFRRCSWFLLGKVFIPTSKVQFFYCSILFSYFVFMFIFLDLSLKISRAMKNREQKLQKLNLQFLCTIPYQALHLSTRTSSNFSKIWYNESFSQKKHIIFFILAKKSPTKKTTTVDMVLAISVYLFISTMDNTVNIYITFKFLSSFLSTTKSSLKFNWTIPFY
jgi:hypothetical protein